MSGGAGAAGAGELLGRSVRFSGRIAGFGTASGTRIVVGMWRRSPFGSFADLMVEDASGHRTLLAPTPEVADFIASTYRFDEVRVVPVRLRGVAGGLAVDAGPGVVGVGPGAVAGASEGMLRVRIQVGEVSGLGRLLRAVPAPVATSPVWLSAIDPIARRVMAGVRTAGTAGAGRREFYGVTVVRRIAWASATLDGVDLGAFAPLDPPVRFGFGSAPVEPSIVDVTTTIRPS